MPADDDRVESEASLAELSGRPVPIQERRTLAQKAWIEMALQNARLAILARNQASAQQEVRPRRPPGGSPCSSPSPSCASNASISVIRWARPPSSCVVYDGHRMKKSDYRRFNIRDIQPATTTPPCARRSVGVTIAWPRGGGGARPDPDRWWQRPGCVRICGVGRSRADHLPMIGVAKGEERKPGLETLIFPDEREPLQLPRRTRHYI